VPSSKEQANRPWSGAGRREIVRAVTDRETARLGVLAAVSVTTLVAAFGVSLVAGLWAPTLMASFVAALLLAPAFVAMMVAIAVHASPEKRAFGQLGATFAAIYAVMVTVTYYLQLTVVRTADDRLSAEALRLLAFTPGSALFALDMLGYGFMTLATLAAAPVFVGPGLARRLRMWFFAHGLLVVPTVLAPAMMAGGEAGSSDFIGSLVLIGWSVFFLPLAGMVAVYFARQLRAPRTKSVASALESTTRSGAGA
jgi:hypothetical protein